MTVIRARRSAFFLLALISSASTISLPEKYDHSVRPNNGGVGDVVNVSIHILTIRDINEDEQNISVDLLLRTFWGDKRLANIVERETVFADKIPEIWIPHLSIVNSAETKYSDRSLKLTSDGSLDCTERITAKLNCPISSVKYPFGQQTCQLQLNSNGYTTIHLMLIWHGLISQDIPTLDPEYNLLSMEQSSGRQKTRSGEYSYVHVDITVARCALRVITRAFVPTLFVTALSYYITFFMKVVDKQHENSEEDLEDVNKIRQIPRITKNYFDIIRVTINALFTLLVVIISQLNFLKSPRSAAITGLDVWVGMMGVIITTCLILSLRMCFNETEEKEKVTKKVSDVLKVGIPVVFFVFLITYFGFYLS